jgi:hypothetical protein
VSSRNDELRALRRFVEGLADAGCETGEPGCACFHCDAWKLLARLDRDRGARVVAVERPRFEVRNDERGELDEVVACRPAFFYLERMDRGSWWMSVEVAGGDVFHVDLVTVRAGKVHGRVSLADRRQKHACSLCRPKKRGRR